MIKKGASDMNIIIALMGICAVVILIYYVYILMKGDSQK